MHDHIIKATLGKYHVLYHLQFRSENILKNIDCTKI